MTTHTPAERTEIAALRAAGLTQQQIAARTGVPRRSVGYILAHDQDVVQAVAVETREQITERMRRVHSLGWPKSSRRSPILASVSATRCRRSAS